jgi:hypothetical protein
MQKLHFFLKIKAKSQKNPEFLEMFKINIEKILKIQRA